ncbi:type II toxin-antitoxin system VapC family toxin [Thermococcus celer]|uniref:PIN domain-containing protein n=1 Tax=Thermococcus celer Vu 13 = JCM 8558 TaxID=1293037 RepID=A0A218P191_THECE|nr:type II toxin-antitoxin system VapC family toxin [Thermococcus celer]ASI98673.1 hypothetical protein A3L02_03395 [Thermococcus celer Vu 13 = JCM 8558]
MVVSEKIMFDSSVLLKIHTKKNSPLLEMVLLKFEPLVSEITLYEYLSTKAALGKDPYKQLLILKEMYQILPLDEKIIVKASVITGKLLRKRVKLHTNDVLVGVTAIVHDALLVVDEPGRYKPLRKYGLDLIDFNSFAREMEHLAEDFTESKETQGVY